MTCRDKTIKTGNPFNLISIFRNAVTREPIEITADMQFAATIINARGQVIATCEVAVLDQMIDKGGVKYSVNEAITATWKAGTAQTDIKVTIGGVPTNSGNYSFTIERSITP